MVGKIQSSILKLHVHTNQVASVVATERSHRWKVESKARGLLKALSWRLMALVTTMALVLIITGEVAFAALVGGVDALAKIGLYYFHERTWTKIGFGLSKGP